MKRLMAIAAALALLGAAPPAQPPCQGTSNGFTVTQGGFVDPAGHPWHARGVNMDTKDAMPMANGQFFQHFPGTTFIRLAANCDTDTTAVLDPIVLAVTGSGRVLSLEDHHDTQGGRNTACYQAWGKRYASNALVWYETPNEPPASMTGAPQTAIINALRAAGVTAPIGIQPICCEDQSNVPGVLASVTSKANLYVSMHVYCGDGADASCPTSYPKSASQPAYGLFHLIDEFGDAADGMKQNQYGPALVRAMTDLADGIFWHCCNGFHETDSACTDQGCGGLTPDGNVLKPWLSSTGGSCPLSAQTSAPSAAAQAELEPLQQQIDSLTQGAAALLNRANQWLAPSAETASSPPPQAAQAAPPPVPVSPAAQASPAPQRVQSLLAGAPQTSAAMQSALQDLQNALQQLGTADPGATDANAGAAMPAAPAAPTKQPASERPAGIGQDAYHPPAGWHEGDGDDD
jgi:hypothetical protein